MNKNSLLAIIFIIAGASAVFIKDTIAYCDIINISKSSGINNMIIYLISWISVFIIGFVICLYLKKRRLRHNTR
jgi:hypothetical protein